MRFPSFYLEEISSQNTKDGQGILVDMQKIHKITKKLHFDTLFVDYVIKIKKKQEKDLIQKSVFGKTTQFGLDLTQVKDFDPGYTELMYIKLLQYTNVLTGCTYSLVMIDIYGY